MSIYIQPGAIITTDDPKFSFLTYMSTHTKAQRKLAFVYYIAVEVF